ncbi:lytic transglycosylase domain-containing protein [Thalassolituus marinus]|uniref:lytic transglycosylase domain-containing protein n=1 Tax=Thalassolituus marinus TaxID=671053 RepID=UPI001CE31644|nr:lytic transglycosylase domain-containing protein [Thalassolituus marinus]
MSLRKARVRSLRTLAFLCLLLGLTLQSQAQVSAKADPELRKALMDAVNNTESFADQYDAQVWLVDMSARLKRYMKDDRKRMEFLRLVHQEATRAELSPELVMSLIHVESAFDRFALSYVGAQGYMQIMPFWKKEIGRPDDNLMNTATNLRYGCTILKHYLKREKGDWIRALARYNGSLGRTKYPEKVMLFWEKYWFVNY